MLKHIEDILGLVVIFGIAFIAFHFVPAVEAAIIAAKGN